MHPLPTLSAVSLLKRKEKLKGKGTALVYLYLFFWWHHIMFSLSGWLTWGSAMRKDMVGFFGCLCAFVAPVFLYQKQILVQTESVASQGCQLSAYAVLDVTRFPGSRCVLLNSHPSGVPWNSVLMGHFECYMWIEQQKNGVMHIAPISSAHDMLHCPTEFT